MRWIPVVVWSVAIWIVSGIGQLPPIPGSPGDKSLHLAAYFIHGLCSSVAIGSPDRRGSFGLAFLMTAAFGAIDEIHQAFVPGRDSSWLDLVADLAGGALAIALAAFVARRRRAEANAS